MSYVLVLITVFIASNSVHSQTTYQPFGSKAACERAAQSIKSELVGLKGQLGREVIAQCHKLK